jgi:hypothetical protein
VTSSGRFIVDDTCLSDNIWSRVGLDWGVWCIG